MGCESKTQQNGEDGLLEYLEVIIGSHRVVPVIEELGKEVRPSLHPSLPPSLPPSLAQMSSPLSSDKMFLLIGFPPFLSPSLPPPSLPPCRWKA